MNDAMAFVRARSKALGFDVARVATATEFSAKAGERLGEFLADGRHGTMGWMADTAARRAHPNALWPEARSVIVLGVNYGPESDPLADLERPDHATISVYARNRDYHDVIKGKLKTLAGQLAARHGGEVKVFVDTAPLMEKPLAEVAGLGWQGKHTNLVSREFGSWLFLGAILTTLELAPDTPETDHCGSCRRCLDICPTDAFPAPYQLDARRCLSYLTIESKAMIPRCFRRAMGNRVFGCDDCLAVCPWNKFARAACEAKLAEPEGWEAPPLAELGALDDAAFRRRFAHSPIKRAGRERFVRNVMIAIGNARDPAFGPLIEERLADEAPQVRAAAVWAAGETFDPRTMARLKAIHADAEHESVVRAEWDEVA